MKLTVKEFSLELNNKFNPNFLIFGVIVELVVITFAIYLVIWTNYFSNLIEW